MEGTISSALGSGQGTPPELLYWDLDLFDGSKPVGELCFGRGGLDPLLMADHNLSDALAINEHALTTLVRGGSLTAPRDLFRAANLLLRSPATRSLYCPGLRSRCDISKISRRAPTATQSASSETISIALISLSDEDGITAFLDSLLTQEISAKVEIVALIAGPDGGANKRRGQAVDIWAQAHGRFRVRRFLMSGEFDRAYLANTAAALANGEVLVLADPSCRPQSASLLQNLADWSNRADTATVSPRVDTSERLFAAGLVLTETPDGQTRVAPLENDVLCDGPRLSAAPSPWLFAVRRRQWIAAGGAPVHQTLLWTSALAGESGPQGRHVMLGSETALWTGGPLPDPSGLNGTVPGRLRPSAWAALRSGQLRDLRISRWTTPPLPAKHGQSALAAAAPDQKTFAFSDPVPERSGTLRVLVFADAYGPSQSIAFVDGLSISRKRGDAAVRIFAEQSFAESSESLDLRVAREFERFRPTQVVLSRMAEPELWRAIRDAARSRQIPILFHVDDDLFDLPVVLGIDRYRLARHPRRLHTLHDVLNEADLVMAATPALSARLSQLADHGRIITMPIGSAGAPPQRRAPRLPGGRLMLGYMGSASHSHDLELIAPALNRILKEYREVELTLFGSIGKQPAAKLIKGRLKLQPGVFGDYLAFRQRLAALNFDIGLAPLRDIPFNRVKTATKWVEYAEAGVPVLASDIEPYRPIAAAGALLSVRPGQWEAALRDMIESQRLRAELVRVSDALLVRDFSWERLEAGVLKILRLARARKMVA